jgi:hypothetical protein
MCDIMQTCDMDTPATLDATPAAPVWPGPLYVTPKVAPPP